MLAAAPGVVAYVRNTAPAGNFAGRYAVIDHGNGTYTRYLHADHIYAQTGDRVGRGDQIGLVGDSGTTSTAPHVHFDVKLTPEALAKYQASFGKPTTGFAAEMKPWGFGVPAEALMDKARYRPGVLEQALAKGVSRYSPLAVAGIGIAGLVAIAGGGYLFYRYLTR